MAWVVRVFVNPSNTDQRYVLWSNGYWEPRGGALTIEQQASEWGVDPYPKAPTMYGQNTIVSGQITDWTGPGGYMVDCWGSVYAFGTAAQIPGPAPYNYYFDYPMFGFVCDIMMNPAANGQGYYLQYNGDLIAFGTGTPAVAHSAILSDAIARRLVMDWASKRYWVIDNFGRVWGMNGGNNVTPEWSTILGNPEDGMCRDAYFYDKSATPKGWVMDSRGAICAVGGAEFARGSLFYWQQDKVKAFTVLDDGTGINPLRILQVEHQGAMFEFVSSTAPSCTVIGPADPVTTTTHPKVEWGYTDPQNDGQAAWEVAVFTAAQYGIGGFNAASSPATWRASGTGLLTRSATLTQELANATYRAYVRVQDTSGLWSSWSYKQWVQNVTPPATPTIGTRTLNGFSAVNVAINVNPSGLSASARFLLQYHDADWDGVTWQTVKGGYDVDPDGSGDATVVDYEARYGVQRTYRALTYIYDSATQAWISSAWSATQTYTLTGDGGQWVLSVPTSPADVMKISVSPGLKKTQTVVGGVFTPAGRTDPIVITDGRPKNPQFNLDLWVLDKTTRQALETILNRDATMLMRDPFGNAIYFRIVGEISWELMRAVPAAGETTKIRDAHKVSFPCYSVKRPLSGVTFGPLAEVA